MYDAYKAGERIAKLDPKRARIMRICNMGRKYGVSPIVRALRSALMLENIEDADYINNKAKAKKIIHQILRKETMGTIYEKQGLSQAAYAHGELMKAWKNKTVVYTSAPFVEKIQYVEPSVSDTASDKINLYRSKIMTTLGIGFIDSNTSSFSVANISLEQLMKTINSISEQLERIIMDFYKVVLTELKAWIDTGGNIAIKKVLFSNNSLLFYKNPESVETDEPQYKIDLPVERFLDQAKTTLVPQFAWSEELYPGSVNPGLEGKPVFVLAVRGISNADGGTDTATYSFLNMASIITLSTDADNSLSVGSDGGLYSPAVDTSNLRKTTVKSRKNTRLLRSSPLRTGLSQKPTRQDLNGSGSMWR